VLDELGIPTPEELGYDKPEFFIPRPEFHWEKKWYCFCLALLILMNTFLSRYKDYGYDKMPGYKHFA